MIPDDQRKAWRHSATAALRSPDATLLGADGAFYARHLLDLLDVNAAQAKELAALKAALTDEALAEIKSVVAGGYAGLATWREHDDPRAAALMDDISGILRTLLGALETLLREVKRLRGVIRRCLEHVDDSAECEDDECLGPLVEGPGIQAWVCDLCGQEHPEPKTAEDKMRATLAGALQPKPDGKG